MQQIGRTNVKHRRPQQARAQKDAERKLAEEKQLSSSFFFYTHSI